MAREVALKCDICRKSTNKIVAKLHYIPMDGSNGKKRSAHSNYTHHLDVGECCGQRVLQLFNFRPRVTAEEYQASRRRGG